MANTYSQIYVQIVFAVSGRANLIKSEWKEELYKYVAGIIKNYKQKLISIGGVADHIHLLLGIEPNIKLSDLVREIRANSSRFINEKRFLRENFRGGKVSERFHIPVHKSARLFITYKIRKIITTGKVSKTSI